GGPLDRLHDVVVAGAAAEVALELVADLLFRRLRIALEQLVGGHDHTRRAEAALEPVLLPEPLLDRMQLAVPREALDRRDGGAVSRRAAGGRRRAPGRAPRAPAATSRARCARRQRTRA